MARPAATVPAADVPKLRAALKAKLRSLPIKTPPAVEAKMVLFEFRDEVARLAAMGYSAAEIATVIVETGLPVRAAQVRDLLRAPTETNQVSEENNSQSKGARDDETHSAPNPDRSPTAAKPELTITSPPARPLTTIAAMSENF